MLVDEADDLLVDQTAEHHLDHVHGLAVGDAHALDEFAFLADFFQQRADLRAAAVHHHRVHADQFHEHDVAREALLEGFVHHGVAAVLDDHGLAAEALDIRQRLDQETRAFAGRLGVDAHGFFSRSCIRSRWTQKWNRDVAPSARGERAFGNGRR